MLNLSSLVRAWDRSSTKIFWRIHYRGTPAVVSRDVVYVLQTDAGQEMLTPAEFAKMLREETALWASLVREIGKQ